MEFDDAQMEFVNLANWHITMKEGRYSFSTKE
jgi:hypothetical protein